MNVSVDILSSENCSGPDHFTGAKNRNLNFSGSPSPQSLIASGLPRHREHGEFECSFFQTGKTQGICQKCFYTGNLPPTQVKFGGFKK